LAERVILTRNGVLSGPERIPGDKKRGHCTFLIVYDAHGACFLSTGRVKENTQ
jgi:hypothetical protein